MSRYPKLKFNVDEATGEVKFPRWASRLNAEGAEVLDTTPLAIPLGFERPPTLEAQIERIMSLSARRSALAGKELDPDDFDVDDEDPDTAPTIHQSDIGEVTYALNTLATESAKAKQAQTQPAPQEAKVEAPVEPNPQ